MTILTRASKSTSVSSRPTSNSALTVNNAPMPTSCLVLTIHNLQDVLFEPDTWKVQSRHNNLVAFKFEVAHLKGALRAASNSNAEFVEIKLSMKNTAKGGAPPPTGGSQPQPQAKPFLCLTSRGQNTDVTHEIPIGRPFSAEGMLPHWPDKCSVSRQCTLLPVQYDMTFFLCRRCLIIF